jgi:heat shock protein HslJ
MRITRLITGLMLALFCISSHAQSPEQKMTLTGKLSRVMAIGGESTGWALQLESATTIDGKQVDSIEVAYPKTQKLEKLENKRVQVTGLLSHRRGVETGERLVLVISTLKEAKVATQPVPAQATRPSLAGSEWLLEDLGGSGVIDSVQATLAFPEAGKVAGDGSCNRFFGPAQISADSIKLGPLASSRMACPEAVMNQEKRYLDALQAAERFEWKAAHLLIYCKGSERPLRFTRMPGSTLATP